MTQDEIIRMAREAGGYTTDRVILLWEFTPQYLERFAALVAAHEREKQAEQEPVADYAYQRIEEYEDLCGMQVNDAFKIGWDMARTTNAMLGIKAAPVEPVKQEPVAWRVRGYNQFKTGNPAPWRYVDGADKPTVNKPDCCDFEPLYAAPVRTKDLTDDEVMQTYTNFNLNELGEQSFMIGFARAVIAADREKNK